MADQNLALYRKYRSATFDEVIGQEHVTEPLKTALAAHRVNHAYLFSGPRGCGKTSSARILARSLNCVQGPTPTPCGVCESCKELAPNGPGSIDVIEIDAASHGGVDDARDLRERAFFAPARDRYKVYIIDEAHMVSTQGFNALLKLVEEPPEFLVFVFATTEPDKVLQTIRSRTHHYPFRLVPPSVMRAHLERICAAEAVAVEQAVFPLVVRAGGGSVRDSLSLLDQLLAGAGPEGVTYARAVALLGVTDAALLDDMIDALVAVDPASVYGAVDRVVEAGHDPRRFAADLLDRFRDLLVLDAVPTAAETGLIDAPGDALSRMSEQAERLGGATAARYAEIVHTALLDMRGTTSPRLVLELVCARMLLPDAAADSAAILQRLDRLERRASLSTGGDAAAPRTQASPPTEQTETATPKAERAGTPRPQAENATPTAEQAERATPPTERTDEAEPASAPPSPTVAATGPPPPAAGGGTLDASAVRTVWPEVKDVVKAESRRTRALLDSAVISTLDGDLLTLTIAGAPLARMLGEDRNAAVVARALTQVLGGTWRLAVVPEGADGGGSAPSTQSAAMPPAATPSAATSDPEPEPTPEPPRRRPRAEDLPSQEAPAPSAPVIDPDADPRDDEPDDPDGPQDAGRRHDPEAEALALLRDGLGARPVDG